MALDIPRGRAQAADGVLLVDKPAGLTSHDVVARIRRLAATRKVGHAGTLDPMATGLLVIGIGRATRLLTHVVGADKTYEATIRLGISTTTDDAEGEALTTDGARLEDVAGRLPAALESLTGEISQVPSSVSAVKVDGERAYARVRAGEDVELAAREVTIHELVVTGEARDVVVGGLPVVGGPVAGSLASGEPAVGGGANGSGDGPRGGPGDVPPAGLTGALPVVDLDVRVRCSSGTYIRAIARDLGDAVGSGGHLTALRRTEVGPLRVSDAATIEELAIAVADEAGDGVLAVPPAGEVARELFPMREVSEDEARALGYGQRIEWDESVVDGADEGGVVGAFAPDGALVALLTREGLRAKPVLVLRPAS
ncbi:tRNA pseudouridine synthase B [Actinomycetales bacterium JB111]|nr:tRNA pseudouridine synthase B [Actinomycetales bacterium JB111]